MRGIELDIAREVRRRLAILPDGWEPPTRLSKRDRVEFCDAPPGTSHGRVVGVILWNTCIAKIAPNGSAWAYTGGWRTRTTKARLSSLGCRVYQVEGDWFLNERPFEEGAEFNFAEPWDGAYAGAEHYRAF